jgi:RNA polymerase sigma factor (sigma-70 family)
MSPSFSLRLLQTQSDARLVELARAGHERAFEALVQRYRKPLLNYCRRLLQTEARAEDALQQGLLQAWLAVRDGREVRDAKAWLYRIVHNAAISAGRRSGYDYVELDESLHGDRAPESDIDRRIVVREALAGLASLPLQQREALLQTAIQGHSHEQVATAMGLTDGAVRGLVYRARATLRTAVTALTPPQLVSWTARAASRGSAHPQLAEITVGGGGSAAALGALLKGGAVVLSAGALATGAGIVQHHPHAGSGVQAAVAVGIGHHHALFAEPAVGDPSRAATSTLSVSAHATVVADDRRRGDRRGSRGGRPERVSSGSGESSGPDPDSDGTGSSVGHVHETGPDGGLDPGASGDRDGSGGDRRSVGGGEGGSRDGLAPGTPGSKGPGGGREIGRGGEGGPTAGSSPAVADEGDRRDGQSSGGGAGGPGPSPPPPSPPGSSPLGPADAEMASSANDSGSDANSNGSRDGSSTGGHGGESSSSGSGGSKE